MAGSLVNEETVGKYANYKGKKVKKKRNKEKKKRDNYRE